MATRNERRKAAKARQQAKLFRLAKAELGRQRDEVNAIVKRNLANKPKRNYYAGIKSSVTICAEAGAHRECGHRGGKSLGLNDNATRAFQARCKANASKR